MPPNAPGWWTDERVDATVTSQYVHSHLRPNEAEQLTKNVFSELSDDTYLEWILRRSKRFFLALVEADVPDQIFGITNDSYKDDDLPIPEDEVPNLLLSAEPDRELDQRFYRAQFKYLIRVVEDGEHIRYAQEETIPVHTLGGKLVIGKSKDGLDKVKLPSDNRRVFARKRIVLNSRNMEEQLLSEMADWRIFAHGHVVSIFGSYTTEGNLYVLMTPAPEYNLKTFLSDTPKAFEAFPKPERRKMILQWCHCLANGLAWLHGNAKHHGAIRPSRVHIDDRNRIYLGLFDGTGILCDSAVKDDIEAYQYAAPERWRRSVTIQATGDARVALPSGGRTARRMTSEVDRTISADSNNEYGPQRINTARPTSVSYVFNPTSKSGSRLRLGSTRNAVAKMSAALRQTDSRQNNYVTDGQRPTRSSLETRARPGAVSVMSSNSSENARQQRRQTGTVYAMSPEIRTTVVQTWVSAQHDQLAADVFSLGAIMMDILTFLCKRSYSSFARHRATKNKSAGRGGGLADASFHVNIGQVFSWADILQKDAEKRIDKDDGAVYKAVGPCLQVIKECLQWEPTRRLPVSELQRKLSEHIRDFAGLNSPQCCIDSENERLERPLSRAASVELLRQDTQGRHRYRNESSAISASDRLPSPTTLSASFLPRIDSLRVPHARTNMVESDADNTPNNSDFSEEQPQSGSRPRPDSFAFATGRGVEVFPRPPTTPSLGPSTSRRRQHTAPTSTEDSEQSSIATPASNMSRIAPTIQAYSAAPSSIGAMTEDFQSVYSYTPPPTAHPTRDLPPVPRSSSLKPNSRPSKTRQPPIPDLEPTALPSIEQHDIGDLQSTAVPNTRNFQHPQQIPFHHPQPRYRRQLSVDQDVDEITTASTSQSASNEQRELNRDRHYRASSRAGLNENRPHAGHLGRDPKISLRTLQYP